MTVSKDIKMSITGLAVVYGKLVLILLFQWNVKLIFHAVLFSAASAEVVGKTVDGPAIITEDETTIIIPTSRTAIRQPDGCIDMRTKP